MQVIVYRFLLGDVVTGRRAPASALRSALDKKAAATQCQRGLRVCDGLVGGGEFAELGYCGGDYFERGGDLLRCGVAAEAEADGSAGLGW